MDPDACYREICEAMEEVDRLLALARERALALHVGLSKGGSYPTGKSAADVRIVLNELLSRTKEQAKRDYPADLSAIEVEIHAKMTTLALEFPTLRDGVPGVSPWDPRLIDNWACSSGQATSGSRSAVQFLLNVWDPMAEWRSGDFSLREAYGVWDDAHWQVLERFIRHPFFP